MKWKLHEGVSPGARTLQFPQRTITIEVDKNGCFETQDSVSDLPMHAFAKRVGIVDGRER